MTACDHTSVIHCSVCNWMRPLRVNGQPIPPEITNGRAVDFARFCGETDPTVLAILDAEDD